MFSAFDLDHTLLQKNSSVEFCKYLYRREVLSLRSVLWSIIYYFQHCYGGMSLEQLHRRSFKKILRGMSLSRIEQYVNDFLDTHLEQLYNTSILARLRQAQARGDFISVLSSSPDFLVGPIAARLGVVDWKASEYQVDKQGCLCQIALIWQGEEKARWVQSMAKHLKIGRKDIVVYSDSHLDLPFLQAAGTAVVVNPDRKLRKISRKWDWEEIICND